MVRQIRQYWNVLRFRIRHVCRRQREQAAKGEEHYHRNHQHTGAGDDFRTFLLGKFATEIFLILFAFRDHEGRNDWREVEREHHDGNTQPYGNQDAVMTSQSDIADINLIDNR
ncbi:hypothetical protein SDC9_183237 [bioreactor metagenome]|uniref:Uncharacterized protein n=1 Tax=bioreactor metagenome TaxID=1076179 RepID=A0A645H9R5_9ZZZZ